MVDYSKWDKMGFSDSSEEGSDEVEWSKKQTMYLDMQPGTFVAPAPAAPPSALQWSDLYESTPVPHGPRRWTIREGVSLWGLAVQVDLSKIRNPENGDSLLDHIAMEAFCWSPYNGMEHRGYRQPLENYCPLIDELVAGGVPVSWKRFKEFIEGEFSKIDRGLGCIDPEAVWYHFNLAVSAGMAAQYELLNYGGRCNIPRFHYDIVLNAIKAGWKLDRISMLRRYGATTRLAILDACQELNRMMEFAEEYEREANADVCIPNIVDRYNSALAWHKSETVFAQFLEATLSARMPEDEAARAVEYLLGPLPASLPALLPTNVGAPAEMVNQAIQGLPDQQRRPNRRRGGRRRNPLHAVATIQDVVHHEVAAQIPPETASEIAAEQWAGWAIENVGAPTAHDASASMGDVGPYQPVYLLRLKRNPRELETRLHEGPELEPVRDAMGFSSRLPSGAAVFVERDQYEMVRQMVAAVTLRPYHVIVQEAFFPLLTEAISHVRSRAGARVSHTETLGYVGADSSFIVENTFFSGAPRVMRNPQSVVQSTAEVHGVVNPRRY